MLSIKAMLRGFVYGAQPGALLTLFIFETLRNSVQGKEVLLFFALGSGVFAAILAEFRGKLGILLPFMLFGQIFSSNYLINSLSLGMAVYYCLAMIFSGDFKKDFLNVLMAALGFLGVFAFHIWF